MSDSNMPLTGRILSWRQAQRSKNEEFQRAVRAMNVDGVRQLADISDAELIATDPSIPSAEPDGDAAPPQGRDRGPDR